MSSSHDTTFTVTSVIPPSAFTWLSPAHPAVKFLALSSFFSFCQSRWNAKCLGSLLPHCMNFTAIPIPIWQIKEVTFFLFPLQDKTLIPIASKQSVPNCWAFFLLFFHYGWPGSNNSPMDWFSSQRTDASYSSM